MMTESSLNVLHVVCNPAVELQYREGPTEFQLGRTSISIHFTAERDNDSVLEVVSVDDPQQGPAILLRPLYPALSGLTYFAGRGIWSLSEGARSFMAFLGEAAFYFSLLVHRSPVKQPWALRDGMGVTLQYVYRRSGSKSLETRNVQCKTFHSGKQVYPVQRGAVYGLTLGNYHPHELHVVVLAFDSELGIREAYRGVAKRARPLDLDSEIRVENARMMREGKIPPRGTIQCTQLWRATQGLLRFTGKVSCIRVVMSVKPLPPWKELLVSSAKAQWDAVTMICEYDTY